MRKYVAMNGAITDTVLPRCVALCMFDLYSVLALLIICLNIRYFAREVYKRIYYA